MSLEKEIKNTLVHLHKGSAILYPSDTVYGLTCDATNKEAIQKIYALKQRDESKSLIVLVNGFDMLEKYVEVTKEVKDYLKNAERPTTVIYTNPQHLPENLIATDNTIAIRIVEDIFSKPLITHFGKPIVSTSANISGEPTHQDYDKVSDSIKENVDYIVQLKKSKKKVKPSTIIKFVNGKRIVLRD